MTKVYYFIFLVFAGLFLPWWLFLSALVISLIIFDWYWPAILPAFLFDAIYGLPTTAFPRTQFIYTVGVLFALVLVNISKRRLIYHRY